MGLDSSLCNFSLVFAQMSRESGCDVLQYKYIYKLSKTVFLATIIFINTY